MKDLTVSDFTEGQEVAVLRDNILYEGVVSKVSFHYRKGTVKVKMRN